ncbi:MAG: M20 metallopeptidase family protein, partial [Planktomarina sp.]
MAVRNRFAELLPEITAWRRDLHENPELLFDTHRTSEQVAMRLKEFGCDEIVTGLGRTGVVGLIKGKSDTKGKVVGLRADMDALPILEDTDVEYASKNPGVMHACGHDVHMTSLIGTARQLATRKDDWNGTLVMIMQPA